MRSFTLISILALINNVLSQVSFDFMTFQDSYLSSELKITRSDDADTNYRLPTSLDPIHYDIEITPFFEAETGKDPFTFDGIVTIVVKVMEDNVCEIVIHEKVKDICGVNVIDGNGQSVNLDPETPYERIEKYNFLRIHLADDILLKDAIYNITVQYTGIMHGGLDAVGVMKGQYKDNDGNIHLYATTKFEPVYTRQAFPCFDEPGFKSTFSIIVNRPATFAATYSNMKVAEEIPCEDRIKEIFHVTPRMSAYLVSFHISEDFTVIADNNNATHPFRVIARPNAVGQGDYGLEIGTKALAGLIDYLGIDSYTMAENFNEDHIALPDFNYGAIENWGSIHYRELTLLFEDGEDSRSTVSDFITHEMTHKWFGNLVTCRWWENTWLNEGFANYFQSLILTAVDDTSYQTHSMATQTALNIDSDENTKALQRTVYSPIDAKLSFHRISYRKGAALLIMTRELVSEDIFRKAIKTYLIDNAYEYVEPEDLYTAFATTLQGEKSLPSDIDIKTFMKAWVEEPGHPLINVHYYSETGLISLQQERFLMNASATPTEQVWPVPLTFTTGTDPDWDNLVPSHVMTDKCLDIQGTPGQHWVIFNMQQKGLYRVNYDTSTWQNIAQTLQKNIETIHHLNRAQIVNDVFALMVSKKITFAFGFQIIDFLKQETNYYVWNSAIEGFNLIANQFFHLSDLKVEFKRLIRSYLDAVINDVGYDVKENESRIMKVKRLEVLAFACKLGHEGCINAAVSKFTNLKTSGSSSVLVDLTYVYYTGVRVGDYEDWSFVNQLKERSNNDYTRRVLRTALMCTKNEQALQEFLDNFLKTERFSIITYLELFAKTNERNSVVLLEYTKHRIEELRTAGINIEDLFNFLPKYLLEDNLNDMEQWLCENEASIPEYAAGMKAIETARSRLQQGWPDADRILAAVRGASTHGVPSVSSMLDNLISTGVTFISNIYNELPSMMSKF